MAAPSRRAAAPVTDIVSKEAAPRPQTPVLPSDEPRCAGQFPFRRRLRISFLPGRPLAGKAPPQPRAGGNGRATACEVVRFRSHLSLAFPPSQIYEIERPSVEHPVPTMTVNFLGLTGPSGVLPAHYTELLLRLRRGEKWPEQNAGPRLARPVQPPADLTLPPGLAEIPLPRSLQARRIRRDRAGPVHPLPFQHAGSGNAVVAGSAASGGPRPAESPGGGQPRRAALAQVDDSLCSITAVCWPSGRAVRLRWKRCCKTISASAAGPPVSRPMAVARCRQSVGPGRSGQNNGLGRDAVAGERVWDVQGKFRVRVGPLDYAQLHRIHAGPGGAAERKAFFLLVHLVRLYVGPEFAFDVQLVLRGADVPPCQLAAGTGIGPRLGWNTWAFSQPFADDVDDACFEGEEQFVLSAN